MWFDALFAACGAFSGLAGIALLPNAVPRGSRSDVPPRVRWLAWSLLGVSVVLWIVASGWQVGVVHWLISLSIAGPFVVIAKALDTPLAPRGDGR